jgi:hypothetical protein
MTDVLWTIPELAAENAATIWHRVLLLLLCTVQLWRPQWSPAPAHQ